MDKETAIKLFEDKRVRVLWDDEQEKWFFSIIDVVGVLSESTNPRKYWSVLKTRLKAEDGKMRMTDVADTEEVLRLIQSIPSPKAEPFKMWLAKVGNERIDETADPELAIERALETYLRKGYSKEWIDQRLKTIEVRKELTDEWNNRGVKMNQKVTQPTQPLSSEPPLLLHLELTNPWSSPAATRLLMQHADATKRGTITRDLLIPAEMTLHQLHYAVQRLFGWQNSHLRAFRLDEKDYERLTDLRFREWAQLAGVLFRGIVTDLNEQFWDDDYTGGNMKSWLRKKYTGPFVNGNRSEDFINAQDSITELLARFPVIDVLESFHDFYERTKGLTALPGEKPKIIRTAPPLDLSIAELESTISFDSGFDELLERLAVKTILGTRNQRLAEFDELTQIFDDEIPRPVTKKLIYNYDFGDNWIVEITRHTTTKTLPEQDGLDEYWVTEAAAIVTAKHQPVCIQKKGGYVMDDVGGMGGFAELINTIYQSPDPAERQECRSWATAMGWSNRKIELAKML